MVNYMYKISSSNNLGTAELFTILFILIDAMFHFQKIKCLTGSEKAKEMVSMTFDISLLLIILVKSVNTFYRVIDLSEEKKAKEINGLFVIVMILATVYFVNKKYWNNDIVYAIDGIFLVCCIVIHGH